MLTTAGIPCTVVLDSAVAYAIEKVDFVLMGSEAVVESGGLVNAVGSNQIAIIAKAANKPFYALAERHLFSLLLSRGNGLTFPNLATNFIGCSHFHNMIFQVIIPVCYLFLKL